ncbi:MAG: hypothetical protein RIC06_00020 [Cyclobacteriaceae bacterium]
MEDKIRQWLNTGGFPLEMKFANALLSYGFDVAQSVYFKDGESGKYRETDIIANKYKYLSGQWIHVTFVVECKRSDDKPWVILKNNGLSNHLGNQLPIYCTTNANNFIQSVSEYTVYKSDLLFKNERSIGYSVQAAFNKGMDKSYESIQSVTKACEYFSSKLNERRNVCAFYFPILLVEGNLFEATYNNGETEINKVSTSEILLTRSFHEHGNSHIFLFDHSNLDSICKRLGLLADEFLEKYEKQLNKINSDTNDRKAYG